MADTPEPAVTPAVRLIFEYDGDEVRLVSQQPVDVAVSGFDLAPAPVPGHYVEMRSAANEPLNRVPVRGAFATSAEVFPEQHGEPITRVDVAKPKGAFTVVVPAGPQAVRAALLQVMPSSGDPTTGLAPRLGAPAAGTPEVREIATFELTR
jgi:hypothetical protein